MKYIPWFFLSSFYRFMSLEAPECALTGYGYGYKDQIYSYWIFQVPISPDTASDRGESQCGKYYTFLLSQSLFFLTCQRWWIGVKRFNYWVTYSGLGKFITNLFWINALPIFSELNFLLLKEWLIFYNLVSETNSHFTVVNNYSYFWINNSKYQLIIRFDFLPLKFALNWLIVKFMCIYFNFVINFHSKEY